MDTHSQFTALWAASCRSAVWQLVQNGGSPLTKDQLLEQLNIAATGAAVAHAIAIAKLLGKAKLDRPTTDALVRKCLRLGWIADALHAVRVGKASNSTKSQLIKALVRDGGAKNKTEAKELLSPSY